MKTSPKKKLVEEPTIAKVIELGSLFPYFFCIKGLFYRILSVNLLIPLHKSGHPR